MQKIRYRLVYNRKNQLNHQGTALVQVEAKLNQRNIYLTTNIYLQPEHWDKNSSQVINHPQAIELNALLFEFIIHCGMQSGRRHRLPSPFRHSPGRPSKPPINVPIRKRTCCPPSASSSSSGPVWTSLT